MKKYLLFAGLCFGALLTPFASAQAAPFLATFRTTTANESVTLPSVNGTSYNYTVDWGDGTGTSDITSHDDPDLTHVYAAAGDYQISITGSMPDFNFNATASSRTQIISLDDAGDVGLGVGITTFYGMFNGCSNLTSVALFDTSSGLTFRSMFQGASSLTSIPQFDTSSGTNFQWMFRWATSLTTIPLLNTSSGTNFANMFEGATSLTTIPLIDTSSGTTFYQMFYGASSLTTLPLLDTSSGTEFFGMLRDTALTVLPAFDLSAGTNFTHMLTGLTSMTDGDMNGARYSIVYPAAQLGVDSLRDIFTGLGTADNTSEQQTLYITGNPGAFELTEGDYSIALSKGWVVEPAYQEKFKATFRTTTPNESITLPLVVGNSYDFTIRWGDGTESDIASPTAAERVHTYATAGDYQIIVEGAMPYWNFNDIPASKDQIISIDSIGDSGFGVGITDFSAMFSGCTNLTSVALFDTSAGTNFSQMFFETTNLAAVPEFDTSAGTNFSSMFNKASSLTAIPALDTSAGTNFSSMFERATNLASIPLLNTSAGINFSNMFYEATSLTTIPALVTSNGEDFSGMFFGATGLTSVPLLDTAKGTNFYRMFLGASSLSAIPALDTSSGINFTAMLQNMTSLTTIPLLDTSSGENFTNMFYGDVNLLTIPVLDLSAGTNFYRMFYNTTSLTQGAVSGARYNLEHRWSNMAVEELRDVFAEIGTADNSGGQQTLDITGNPGVPELTAADYAVVEAKDWVVIPAYTPTCSDGYKNGDEVGVDCGGSCTDTCFAATFRTTSASESITLPLIPAKTYAFYVDWGDGTQDYISDPAQAERIHTYATAGDYQVNISGSMPVWNFSSVPDSRSKIITLDEPGDVDFEYSGAMFRNCNFLTSVKMPDTSAVAGFNYLFEGCTRLQTVSGLDTSQGTNFLSMFNGCRNLTDPGTINLDNAVDLRFMFQYATSLTSFNLDAPNGELFEGMFLGATSLTNVTVGDISKGTTFKRAFDGCTGLQTISDLNIPLATDLIDMFRSCSSLTAANFLDVSSANGFYRTFEGNRSLTSSIATGARKSIDYSDARLTTTSIRDLFDSVGIADNSVTQQTLNITGNPGQSELTPADYAVVEAKGWLVVPDYVPTCSDGIQNGDETGVDCGGATCGACEVGGGTCANLTTSYFEKFFYHDNPQIQAITTALNDYQYYDCDNKIFRIGNESEQMEDISSMLSLRLTTAELNTINTNKTATYKQSYYDTEAKVFRRGLEDGSLETVNEDERNLTAAEIAAVTTASEGEFYYNITTRMFYIGESDGTLSQLFVTQ